jgi:hypothetical protein
MSIDFDKIYQAVESTIEKHHKEDLINKNPDLANFMKSLNEAIMYVAMACIEEYHKELHSSD